VNQNFADWYRTAVAIFSEDELKKRWAGIEQFRKELSMANWMNLVRLYVEIPPKNDNFVDSFSKAIKDNDDAFSLKDNALELRALAASTILNNLKTASTEADATALAIVTTTHFRPNATSLINSAPDHALDYLSQEGRRVRRALKQAKIDPAKLKVDDELAAAKQALPQMGDYILKLTQSLATAFNENIQNLQEAYQEESDMLWWAFAGYSNDHNVPFSQLSLSASCLVAAKELSILTTQLPGPPTAPAILDKTLRSLEPALRPQVSISDCVNASKRDWRQSFVKIVEPQMPTLGDLCPLITAIAKSIEHQTDTDWHTPFEYSTKISARSEASPVAMSMQMYNECLLLRAASEQSA